ncbi:MAG: hypothetical protein AAFO73_07915 [Pseudomonadota bacterium]
MAHNSQQKTKSDARQASIAPKLCCRQDKQKMNRIVETNETACLPFELVKTS